MDRNGNGIIEESDYWTTSDRYTEEYIKNYNDALNKRAARYNRNNPNANKIGGNVKMPIGSCNLLSCGSFNFSEVTPDSGWGGWKTGVDGSNYAANVAYDCWDDYGTVDYSEGQYISYSNTDANIDTPGVIQQSPEWWWICYLFISK